MGLGAFLDDHGAFFNHIGLYEPAAYSGTGWRTCIIYPGRDGYGPKALREIPGVCPDRRYGALARADGIC